MILGVIIQITPVKGHNATAQFIVGRTITGIPPFLPIKPSVVKLPTVACSSVLRVVSLLLEH